MTTFTKGELILIAETGIIRPGDASDLAKYALALLDGREAAEGRNTELVEFLQHVKKCLVRNREYAPLSHMEIDTLLGIRSAVHINGEG